MNIAAGLFKQLAYKVETSFGEAPGQSGGQLLRRVQSTIDLSKEAYAANEKRTDFQIADYRHGVRRVQGQVTGELSPKTYADLFGVLLKRDFAAVTALTGLSLTIAGTGPTYTVTRAAGDFLTGGLKVGDVIRLTGSFNAANSAKNLLVTDLTATVATVLPLNGSALVAEGPIASATVTVVGKKTYIPTTGHTDKSIAFEHWYTDIVQSELFLGNKIGKASLSLPPTGLATVAFDVMGKDVADTLAKRGGVVATSQYFTTPTAITSTGTLAAVNGVLRAAGSIVGTVTGLTVEINANYTGDPVVGANVIPQMFPGKVSVTGQFTAYFENVTLRDAFINETEIDLIGVFTSDNTAAADFVSVVMPRIKVGSANKDDGDGGLVQTFSFQALLNTAGGTGVKTEKTTFSMQDSAA
ncbi:MAG: hypothetical protein RL758_110 [Pseudomonadota bacterium]|jgi:hypothetical protein